MCTKFDIYVFIVLFSEGNTLQLPVITLQLPVITLQLPVITLQLPVNTLQLPVITLQLPVITLQLPVIVFLNCTLHWIKRNNIPKTDE